jgi:hypothetical protein
MGRGRAKAKQTKVARELKYSTHGTDLEALQRELASGGSSSPSMTADDDADDDPYGGDDGLDDRRWASS